MNFKFDSMCRARLLGGVAAIVVATSGIAVGMAWTPELSLVEPAHALAGGGAPPRAEIAVTNCRGCGVIVALRAIEANLEGSASSPAAAPGTSRYEVTVRLKDGASRRFVEAAPAKWRLGERVIFIDGNGQPDD